jgi:hypothetical protein
MPVVLCGCKTWSLALRGESRPRVFEIMLLRKILEPKINEVATEWRKILNKGVLDLCSSSHIIRVNNKEE